MNAGDINEKNTRVPGPSSPCYTAEDLEACFSRFRPLPHERPVRISDEIEVRLFDAGHVLGSAVIKVTVKTGTESKGTARNNLDF